MPQIHNPDATLDLERAAREVASLGQATNTATAANTLRYVTTAALIDIAASLRALAAEPVPEEPARHEDDEPDPNVNEVEPVEPLDVGDLVTPLDDRDLVGIIEAIGETEGEAFAVVDWGNGDTSKVWLKHLERVTPAVVEYADGSPVEVDDYDVPVLEARDDDGDEWPEDEPEHEAAEKAAPKKKTKKK